MDYWLDAIDGGILLLGLIGNFLTVFVVASKNHMQTFTNKLILNLALSDFLYLCCTPFNIVTRFHRQWVFGKALCKYYYALHCVSIFSGALTFALLSADRFIAVSYPIFASKHRLSSVVLIPIISSWTVAFLASSPVIYYSTVTEKTTTNNYNNNLPHDSSYDELNLKSDGLMSLFEQFTDNKFNLTSYKLSDEIYENYPDNNKLSNSNISQLSNNLTNIFDPLNTIESEPKNDQYLENDFYDFDKYKDLTNLTRLLEEYNDPRSLIHQNTDSHETQTSTDYTCSVAFPDWQGSPIGQSYLIYSTLVGFIIPIITIIVFYSLLISRLSASNKNIRPISDCKVVLQSRKEVVNPIDTPQPASSSNKTYNKNIMTKSQPNPSVSFYVFI